VKIKESRPIGRGEFTRSFQEHWENQKLLLLSGYELVININVVDHKLFSLHLDRVLDIIFGIRFESGICFNTNFLLYLVCPQGLR
jgi:hypothetical protein